MITNHVTLVGLLNAKNYDNGEDIILHLFSCLEDALQSFDFVKAKLYTRFIADLLNANVIQPQSLVALFQSFLGVTGEDGSPQRRKDAYVFLVLHSLPWVGWQLNERVQEGLEEIMATVAAHME